MTTTPTVDVTQPTTTKQPLTFGELGTHEKVLMTATKEIQLSWKKLKERLRRSYQKLRVRILKTKNKYRSGKNIVDVSDIEESETLVEEN